MIWYCIWVLGGLPIPLRKQLLLQIIVAPLDLTLANNCASPNWKTQKENIFKRDLCHYLGPVPQFPTISFVTLGHYEGGDPIRYH